MTITITKICEFLFLWRSKRGMKEKAKQKEYWPRFVYLWLQTLPIYSASLHGYGRIETKQAKNTAQRRSPRPKLTISNTFDPLGVHWNLPLMWGGDERHFSVLAIQD
jgi:hypothetical protein